jgi:hypothetical protein
MKIYGKKVVTPDVMKRPNRHIGVSEFGMIANGVFQSEGCDSELIRSAHE